MPNPPAQTSPAEAVEIERSAFNAAFYELGLRWHWDSATYAALAATPCERARLRRYLESEQPHLLRAYDADFLADAILAVKERCRRAIAACSGRAISRFNWVDDRWGTVGI